MSHKNQILGLVGVALALSACAKLDDKAMQWISSTSAATAVVQGQLLYGEMRLNIDHSGLLSLKAMAPPSSKGSGNATGAVPVTCVGRLHYTGSTSATIELMCSEGNQESLDVTFIGETRGYAYSQQSATSVSFGLDPQQTRAHLNVPQGQQLVEQASEPYLQLQAVSQP